MHRAERLMILKSYELSIRKGPSDKFVDNKYVFIDDRNVCLINFVLLEISHWSRFVPTVPI